MEKRKINCIAHTLKKEEEKRKQNAMLCRWFRVDVKHLLRVFSLPTSQPHSHDSQSSESHLKKLSACAEIMNQKTKRRQSCHFELEVFLVIAVNLELELNPRLLRTFQGESENSLTHKKAQQQKLKNHQQLPVNVKIMF